MLIHHIALGTETIATKLKRPNNLVESNAKRKCWSLRTVSLNLVPRAHNNLGKTNLKNSIERYTDQKWSTLDCRKTIPGRDVKGTGASQELGKHGSIVFPGETTGG